MAVNNQYIKVFKSWQVDWNKFAKEVLKANLDDEQKAILSAVQTEKMISVASGTSRGKDYVAAVAALCFLYLTPKWNKAGELIENTKVAMTAPTDRQVGNIMYPEVIRLFHKAKILPGRLVGFDIRTSSKEWFLTGFKASKDNPEAWAGFHAVNTMFIVTEASGIDEAIYEAIEGCLQNNSRMLIVFNPNSAAGYAARSFKHDRWKSYRLDSLNAANVKERKVIHQGQVNWEWVDDKVKIWCNPINPEDFNSDKGDFIWEGLTYRPNDLFRIKVRGMFPEESEDVLIPMYWIEAAVERWKKHVQQKWPITGKKRAGVDIAGMGTDTSVFCPRIGDFVERFDVYQSGGRANHMNMAGKSLSFLKSGYNVFIDTIGEGAGVYSRLEELEQKNIYSVKFSENAQGLKDQTGVLEFVNMRAYLFWAVRDWLDPAKNSKAMLPDCKLLFEELTEIRWKFQSNGKIIIEPKEDLKVRLKRSPDHSDSLANTFYPRSSKVSIADYAGIFQ